MKKVKKLFICIIIFFGVFVINDNTMADNREDYPRLKVGLLDGEAIEVTNVPEDKIWNKKNENNENVNSYNYSYYSNIYKTEYDKYSTNYYYNLLNSDQKDLYDKLDNLCVDIINTNKDIQPYQSVSPVLYATDFITFDKSKITSADAQLVVRMFRISNPQYYFLMNGWLYGGNLIGLKVYPAFADGENRQKATTEMYDKVDTLLSQIDTSVSKEEQVKQIHDIEAKSIAYLYDNIAEEKSFSQSAYSVFCREYTVCAGYSMAYELMCNALGIDCISTTSSDHQWNRVYLNGSWSNVDVTWDDQSTGVSYIFFKRSNAFYQSSTNSSSHTEEEIWNNFSPKCTVDSGSSNSNAIMLPIPTETTAVPKITIKTNGHKYDVTISSDTSNADIYYSLGNAVPTVASTKSNKYNTTFELDTITQINAIAVSDTRYESEVIHQNNYTELIHDWNNGTITTSPTCTKAGVKTYKCTTCGVTRTETVPKLGHDFSDNWTVDKNAACTASGSKSHHCTRCDEKTDVTEIPATGHKWNNGTITTSPTCTQDGVKTYKCTTCGETRTETVPKLGHNYIRVLNKASYTKDGSIIKKCKKCNHITSKTVIYKANKISLSKTAYVYDKKTHKPSVTIKNSKGTKLRNKIDYKITYSNGCKNIGTYIVIIKFMGNYSGTVKKTFVINPKSIKISSVKHTTNSITLRWAVDTQVTGYNVQYSTYKKFNKKVKTLNITKNKTKVISIKNLKRKTYYYIRIRAYKKIGSKKLYSGWSAIKTVRL